MVLSKKPIFYGVLATSAIALILILSLILGIKGFFAGLFLIGISAILFQYPRTSLYLFLIYLCFGGTITYLVPGVYQVSEGFVSFGTMYPILQIIKDIFYFPALIAIIFFSNTIREIIPRNKPLLWGIGIFSLVCLLTFLFVNFPQESITNEGSPILVGILGFKVWLSYIPLILCGFYLTKKKQQLIFITRLQIVLIITCCLLTLFQYYALTSGLCIGSVGLPAPAFHRASLQARCLVGGSLLYYPDWNLIRLPGTFVAPWQWGWFLISSIFFSVGATVINRDKTWHYISSATSVLVIITTAVSGQRVAIFFVPLFCVLLVAVTEINKNKLYLKLGIIAFVAAISRFIPIFNQAISSLIGRWEYSPPDDFTLNTLGIVINNHRGIFGNGLGTTSSTARKLGDTTLIEVFPAQLIYEMGYLGLITFFILATIIVILGWKSYRKIKDPYLNKFALCLWIFILFISYNPYYYPLNVDPVNVYYWLSIGILLKLPSLENLNKNHDSNLNTESLMPKNLHSKQ